MYGIHRPFLSALQVAEWFAMEKEEFQMKRQIVIDTRKALTRKDLIAVRQKVLAKFGQEEQSGGDDLDLRYMDAPVSR
jgi:hypothetical protein